MNVGRLLLTLELFLCMPIYCIAYCLWRLLVILIIITSVILFITNFMVKWWKFLPTLLIYGQGSIDPLHYMRV